MQVNDLVKVIGADETYEGLAGIVVKAEGNMNEVKLDLVAEPQHFADTSLQFLGR
ncbi:MAG: hypothetical protein WA174_06520 [Rhodoferax sp.]